MVTVHKPARAKKDIGLLICILAAVGVVALCLTLLISSGAVSARYKEFVNRYTESMAASRKSNTVTALMDTENIPLSIESAGQIYNLIVITGMGKPQSRIPEHQAVELRFSDGAVMQFWDVEIPGVSAKQDRGLFVRYRGADGYEYKYDTDGLTLESITNKMHAASAE